MKAETKAALLTFLILFLLALFFLPFLFLPLYIAKWVMLSPLLIAMVFCLYQGIKLNLSNH